MSVEKITLMEFYLIETLRMNDISNEEIIESVKQNNVEAWESIAPQFDFNMLIDLYEKDPHGFNRILTEGYQIKFLTFPGLQRMLEMKFDKIADFDFAVKENGVYNLSLTDDELEQLKVILSPNWHVEVDGAKRISIYL